MPDTLFDDIKKIDLLAHIAQHCGGVPTSPGSSTTTHVNPSPCCGHNDCCTYYYRTNSFKCFSCDAAGDIINLEKIRRGLESNLEAAKALADQYGIPYDGPKPVTREPSPPPPAYQPPPPAEDDTPALPTIDRTRAIALRNLMAEWYHKNLMDSPEALKYQTETRGHSLAVLKQEKVGYAAGGWKFAKTVKAAGFTEEDLHAIGVLRLSKAGKRYPAIDNGVYVYPHRDAQGNVLHFSLKDPDKSKKWQPVKAAADVDWLTFGQGVLDPETAPAEIWLVEGENDRLSLLENGIPNVVAIIGNTKVKEIAGRAGGIAQGRTFFLAFDPDKAGRKYERDFTSAILAGGGTVKSVIDSLATFKDDIDALLHQAENPSGFLAEIIKNAKTLEARPQTGGADGPPDFVFDSYDVLGEMADGDIQFWSKIKNKTYKISLKNLNLNQLIQIGGDEVKYRVSRSQSDLTGNQITFSALAKEIITQANRTQLGYMPRIKQGIHLLDDNRLLLVNGKCAWISDGKTLVRHEYPLIERKFIEFEEGSDWVDPEALDAALRGMNRERAWTALNQFLEILSQWTFQGAMDCLTIAGFIIAQVVQVAWSWRPHLWLSGGAGSGKSSLLELMQDIFGKMFVVYQGNITSEAGLRQSIESRLLMTALDEFEDSQASKNKDREKIIELLRSCGRSGMGAKGSTDRNNPIGFAFRHMVMACSIETGINRAAEKSRYLLVSTKKELNHKTPEKPTTTTCAALKIELIALALWGVRYAMDLIKRVASVAGQDTRFVESIGAPYAMIAVCTDNPEESLRSNLTKYLADYERFSADAVMEDEVALLQEVLLGTTRVPVMQEAMPGDNPKTILVERTVAQILEQDPIPEDHQKALQVVGIKIQDDGYLFIAESPVKQKLLNKTRWKEMNIKQILARLPGAKRCRCRMGLLQPTGVAIPPDIWMGRGN